MALRFFELALMLVRFGHVGPPNRKCSSRLNRRSGNFMPQSSYNKVRNESTPSAVAVCGAITGQHHPNVLPLKREIGLHVLPAVTESLNVMTERKVERIVIDLSNATYIDTAGLAALVLAMQKVNGFGGKFFLAGLDHTMRSIFETSRLDQIFRFSQM